jgi:hypothetical protein
MTRAQYSLPASGSIVGEGGGWTFYDGSTYTTGSRQIMTGGTRYLFLANGLGGTTETRFLYTLPATIWDGAAINPSAVGEVYSIRIQMQAAPTVVGDGYLELTLDIGNPGVSRVDIVERRFNFLKGSGIAHSISAGFPIFCRETFNANGGRFYMTPSINCQVWDMGIFIQRTFSP